MERLVGGAERLDLRAGAYGSGERGAEPRDVHVAPHVLDARSHRELLRDPAAHARRETGGAARRIGERGRIVVEGRADAGAPQLHRTHQRERLLVGRETLTRRGAASAPAVAHDLAPTAEVE